MSDTQILGIFLNACKDDITYLPLCNELITENKEPILFDSPIEGTIKFKPCVMEAKE
jgi:hypothetical protein